MRRFFLRLWNVVRRDRAEQSLSREIASHLAMLEEEFLRRGLSPADAQRAARLAMGGVEQVKESQRDARSFVWLDDAKRDIVHALRLIRRNPLFALTAALSLAIGIGANTAIFTVANALLFRDPVGVIEPARLVDIGQARGDAGINPTSYPNYLDIRQQATLLNGVYAMNMFPHAMSLGVATNAAASAVSSATGVNAAGAEHVYGHSVTTNYFTVLGATPVAGRLFDANDSEQPGASPVVVLSHGLWTRRFNQNPTVIGQTIRLNGDPYTVVGVAPPGFQGTVMLAADVWLPLTQTLRAAAFTERSGAGLMVGARLKPGVTMAQAATEVEAIGQALSRTYPTDTSAPRGLRMVGSSRSPGNGGLLAAFFSFLMIIVSLVLIVACANVAAILLARSTARRREVAVRLAIGAGRGRLVRQLLTETLILFAIGGAAGLLLARVLIATFVPMLPALPFPISVTLALDARVIAFTVGLSLIAALLSGLAPALQASKADVIGSLNSDNQGPSRPARLRHTFVVAQVAFSLLLVVIAGLFVRALQQAGSMDPGYDARGVELVTIDPGMAHYTSVSGPRFVRDLLTRVRQLPNVEQATLAKLVPGGFEAYRLGGVTVPGFAPADGQRVFLPSWNIVEPGYFSTLRIPLIAGRDFNDNDIAGTQPVIILGEAVARRFWRDRPQEAVGKYVSIDAGKVLPSTMLVVGVSRDIRSSSLVDGLERSLVYIPLQQNYAAAPSAVIIAMRVANGQHVADPIRKLVASMDPNLPIISAQTQDEATALGLVLQRIFVSVSGTLGSIGMLLAAIGIYGVTAYTVARRSREIGIRIALGARRSDIARMVVAQGMWLAGIGSAIGLGLAALASQAIAGYLFGIPPLDPVTYISAAVLFATVAIAASYMPARRAMRVDPLSALRHE
jgi:predicted permease